jgi:HEAT repeat protein
VRRAAARALWQIGTPAVKGLVEALHDPTVDVRSSAAEALGAIGDASAVSGLIQAMQDIDTAVRCSAAEALGWIRDAEAVPALIERLADVDKPRWEDDSVADLAAQSLERIGTQEALSAVRKWRREQLAPADMNKPNIPAPVAADASPVPQHPPEMLNELLKSLQDTDWFVRRGAAEALGTMRDPAAVPGLLGSLKDDDSDVRWVSARALGTISDARAINGLLEALHDRDQLVPEAAAWALWQIGKPSVPGLMKAMRDESADVRGAAVEAISAIADPIAVPGLIERLSDTAVPWLAEERICDISVVALKRIGTPEALKAVQQWEGGHLAPAAYEEFKSPDAPPMVTETDEVQVAEAAAEAVINQLETIPELLDALGSDEWALRKSALKLIKQLDDKSILPGLLRMMGDDRPYVRVAATEALIGVADASAVPALLIALNDEKPYMRVAAADALACIKDPAAVSGLLDALADKNRMIGVAVAEALGRIGSDDAVPGLMEAIRHDDPDVRRAAAESLGMIKDSRALPGLLEALHDSVGYVRRAAAGALGAIGDDAAVPGLVARLADDGKEWWEDEAVSDMAVRALERIGSGKALAAVEDWRRARNESASAV